MRGGATALFFLKGRAIPSEVLIRSELHQFQHIMPIPIAYKQTRLSGDADAAPLIVEEATVMERVKFEPDGPSVAFFRRMNATVRGHVIAMIAELIGTTMFLFFSYAAAQIGNEKLDTLRPILVQPGPSLLQISYISAVFGVSLGVNVWIFYRVSGGMFNPAVSLVVLFSFPPDEKKKKKPRLGKLELIDHRCPLLFGS